MKEPQQATRLLTALAHDIRTPLNSMMFALRLLEYKHGERFDDEDRADVATLRSGMMAILDLHETILRHARLADGKMVPEECQFVPDEALATWAALVQPLALQKGLGFQLDLCAPAVVWSDRSMIQHLVGNLLSNAVRYTEHGTIVLRSRQDEGGLTIQVEDTGMGIAPENRERIFDEYFRVSSAVGDGHGLGLAMARVMAGLLGGTLTVERGRDRQQVHPFTPGL